MQKEKKSSTLKYMHPPNLYEMSEEDAASSKLIPDTVPASDTDLYMANFTENAANQWGRISV